MDYALTLLSAGHPVTRNVCGSTHGCVTGGKILTTGFSCGNWDVSPLILKTDIHLELVQLCILLCIFRQDNPYVNTGNN